ncbi:MULTISPECIES: glutathione S-transferase family protein [Alphaproteobacteria]|uniref:Beta-aryl ether-cleaving enzyme n=2 Tax=Alphaproteobacteria TaxID=28211 RepID=A0A512HGP6_9HYPH|nr:MULTISPECIES: glutathione S-transferase family protein [Alphaproteobacteria]GEO84560.1 beta-aryl ether-cleaving enzyme [Ciceribacter naphthalenivorans]GLR22523.1 beta-aryl ether-cleaving enzyme [Ciceribacter naphthalenivorans]GLT05379.1 beta-aryl ether-cleaving enzyme [Sphingomonas psychrolutea]
MSITLYSLCGSDRDRPFSPHCWKVVMALKHKGLSYVEQPMPFTAISEIEGGVSKTVPILRDGDRLIADSFAIALYLEETYPTRPSLFAGEGGKALSRFVEGYSQTTIHPAATRIAIKQIHDMLDPEDQVYFRESRKERLGKTVEEVAAGRDAEIEAFPETLKPLRHMLSHQPFIGGAAPLFADFIVFGALQWLRIVSGSIHLPAGDPVGEWFERCLDLYDGEARRVA